MSPNEMRSTEIKDRLLLADIGNTHFHIYNGREIEHLSYEEAIRKYNKEALCYISVKQHFDSTIENIALWKNISPQIHLEGAYETMGVDRRALCLSHENGLFVDAGSAITVDIMEEGKYRGGFILPGIKAMLQAYRSISPVLDTTLNETISLEQLPSTTKDGISYGIIASIKALIDKHSDGKKLYFTGGDGKFLSSFFEEATYDEMLVFNGMRKVIKESEIC
ncbi:type III pantothenate kinase [Sulfurovum sp. TSL6]|uniref:type III pantothenate kinase n=1 Tax=Sulfurovum sp. TSL6 TaxID=2826995 RepID=UPI001CC6256B|nr:type III pantothenate kinase [Sulfurovum sp. TSL6]GIU01532.1 type III pantothenate kinase [Sulfurovum sp. TSL6]